MADGSTEYIVKTRFEGENELRRAANEMNRLGDAARRATAQDSTPIQRSSTRWTELASGVALASGAMYAAVAAGRQIYDTLKEGAALQTTIQRFEKLSESIGTTADALRNDLRESTRGMIDDATLMASASQLMSLGLADNHEQVVRLATVSGQLGWDMQQVILTFANLSTMRLDALGLSVDEVKQKQKELMEQGLSTAEAFKEAVIQAGEARLDIQGVSESEQAFKQAEAAVVNFKNAILESTIATLAQVGAFEDMAATASAVQFSTTFRAEIIALREEGKLTWLEWLHLMDVLAQSGGPAAQAELSQILIRDALTDTRDELNDQLGAWQLWARQVSIQSGAAAQDAIANLNAVFGAAAGFGNIPAPTDWFGGGNRPTTSGQFAEDWQDLQARQRRRVEAAQNRARMEDSRLDVQQMNGMYAKGAEAVRGYGSALSAADTEQQRMAEGAARMVATFRAEIVDMNQFMKDGVLDAERYTAALNEGLINAEGRVNVEAMNQALYAQTEAAGASAATLALLGVATGKFTEEQAEAALKAAVLQEQIRAIAEAVTAGDLTIGQGLEALNQARQNIDAGNIPLTTNAEGAMQDVEGVKTAIEEMVGAEYMTVIDLDYTAVDSGVVAVQRRLDDLPSTVPITIQWNQVGGDFLAAMAAYGQTQGGR